MEPFLHGVPIFGALSYSIALLVGKHFNNIGLGSCTNPCYFPPHCYGYDEGEIRDGFEIPCGRGLEGTGLTSIVFHMLFTFIPVLVIVIALIMIHRTVREQENKLSRYGVGKDSSANANIKQFNTQCTRFTTAFQLVVKIHNIIPPLEDITNQNQYFCDKIQLYTNSDPHDYVQGIWVFTLLVFVFWSSYYCFDQRTCSWRIILHWFCLYHLKLNATSRSFNLLIYMYPKVLSARKLRRGSGKVPWCKAISSAFRSRGSNGKRRGPRQPSSLRGDNRPLRSRNDNQSLGSTRTVRFKDVKTMQRSLEPQEEEEKCEVQPAPNAIPNPKIKCLYAPNFAPIMVSSNFDSGVKMEMVENEGTNGGGSCTQGKVNVTTDLKLDNSGKIMAMTEAINEGESESQCSEKIDAEDLYDATHCKTEREGDKEIVLNVSEG